MKTGIVNFFSREKGFGFISLEKGGELFFHVSGLLDEIKVNDTVAFEIQEMKSGPVAIHIRLVKNPSPVGSR